MTRVTLAHLLSDRMQVCPAFSEAMLPPRAAPYVYTLRQRPNKCSSPLIDPTWALFRSNPPSQLSRKA